MKLSYTIILINFFCSFIYSQNYTDYYNQSNKADSLKFHKNYEMALINYEEAFKLVNFVHSDKLISAGVTAINLKKFDVANNYFEKAVKQSGNKNFLTSGDFKKNKEKFKNLIDNLPQLETEFSTKTNLNYKIKIDSLYTLDQDIRNKKTLTQEKDDLIFKALLKLIETYGFPSEKEIGYKSSKNANIILHHNLRLIKNENFLIDFSNKHLKSGEYRPEDFAWTIDQNYVWFKKQKPIYYFQIIPTKYLSDEIKLDINKKRKGIGLKPIEAYKEGKNTFRLLW